MGFQKKSGGLKRGPWVQKCIRSSKWGLGIERRVWGIEKGSGCLKTRLGIERMVWRVRKGVWGIEKGSGHSKTRLGIEMESGVQKEGLEGSNRGLWDRKEVQASKNAPGD